MKRIACVVAFLSILPISSTHAQNMYLDTKECPDRTRVERWCALQLEQQGWMLKYRSESPSNLADAYWYHEIWVRGDSALMCRLDLARAMVRSNGCEVLREVSAQ
jgi:hypothetical protein